MEVDKVWAEQTWEEEYNEEQEEHHEDTGEVSYAGKGGNKGKGK